MGNGWILGSWLGSELLDVCVASRILYKETLVLEKQIDCVKIEKGLLMDLE